MEGREGDLKGMELFKMGGGTKGKEEEKTGKRRRDYIESMCVNVNKTTSE